LPHHDIDHDDDYAPHHNDHQGTDDHDDHSPFDHDHHVVNHDDDSTADDDNQPDHDLNHGNATADHYVVHLSPANHGAQHRPNHHDDGALLECPLYAPER
jgi:hypothetical protein